LGKIISSIELNAQLLPKHLSCFFIDNIAIFKKDIKIQEIVDSTPKRGTWSSQDDGEGMHKYAC
jgi:hypothetical protein